MSYTDQDIRDWFAQNPNVPANQVAQLMQQHRVTPEQVAGAVGWDPGQVRQIYNRELGIQGSGLGSALTTLGQGGEAATKAIGQTQQQVGDIYKQGLGYLQPFMGPGQGANDLQAALSGALGPDAQRQAFANYQTSPGVQFAQQEAERALLRNASATGGLGGGNVLRDLTKLAAGTFMQDYNNQFGQIGQVADRGYGAATTGAGLQGQQGQVQAGLGQFAANIPMNVAGQQAGMQFQAGRDIASAIGGTTSALADLQNKQGAGMTDIYGGTTNNLAALYDAAMRGDATAKEQLAGLLGNLSVQQGSQVAGLPMVVPQPSNLLGTLGQVASGIGGAMYGYSQMNPQQTQSPQMTAETAMGLGLYPGGPARFSNQSSAYGPYADIYRTGAY